MPVYGGYPIHRSGSMQFMMVVQLDLRKAFSTLASVVRGAS